MTPQQDPASRQQQSAGSTSQWSWHPVKLLLLQSSSSTPEVLPARPPSSGPRVEKPSVSVHAAVSSPFLLLNRPQTVSSTALASCVELHVLLDQFGRPPTLLPGCRRCSCSSPFRSSYCREVDALPVLDKLQCRCTSLPAMACTAYLWRILALRRSDRREWTVLSVANIKGYARSDSTGTPEQCGAIVSTWLDTTSSADISQVLLLPCSCHDVSSALLDLACLEILAKRYIVNLLSCLCRTCSSPLRTLPEWACWGTSGNPWRSGWPRRRSHELLSPSRGSYTGRRPGRRRSSSSPAVIVVA